MDPAFIGSVMLAVATLTAAIIAAVTSFRIAKRTKTNHGKNIGQHVEEASLAAQEANLNAQLVALQLEKYKQEQAVSQQRQHDLIQQYVDTDAAAHTELRALIMQVALGQEPPKG